MKLTKGMKKALSLLLSAAMVVTGVNVTTNTAKAADGTVLATWTGEMYANANKKDKATTDAAGKESMNGQTGAGKLFKEWSAWNADSDGYNGANVSATFATTGAAVERSVKVYGSSKAGKVKGVAVESAHATGKKNTWGGDETESDKKKELDAPKGEFVATVALAGVSEFVTINPLASSDVVITKIEFIEGTLEDGIKTVEAQETEAASESSAKPTTTSGTSVTTTSGPATSSTPGSSSNPATSSDPATSDAPGGNTVPVADMPEKGSMSEFCMYVANFADTGWGNAGSKGVNDNALVIKENGTYTFTVTPEADADGIQVFYLDTNLYNGSTTKDFKLTLDKVANGDDEVTVAGSGYMLFADTDVEKNMRVNVVNPWNYLYEDDLQTKISEDTFEVNAFGKTVAIKEGQDIKVTVTVSGMDANGELYTYPKADTEQGGGDTQTTTPPTTTSTAAAQPTTPSTGSVTSNSGVTTTAVVGTQKIKPAKTSVVVAANKSVKVSFTKTLATGVTQAAVVTSSIANKKVVASAAVKSTSEKKGTVTIKAAKKATKGASTKVTLKSTNKDGKTVSAKITVKIQNKVKKVKAAKKAVTIKKKGKTAKLVLKVTAENKKKATTDSVSIKGAGKKVVSIKSAKAAKGKITVTLKGKKKGSKKVAFKVGSKTVKVKVTVKK